MILTPENLLEPTYPFDIHLIGAGGTGLKVLRGLCELNEALMAFEKPGISVTLYDGDIIEASNLGRQMYHEDELGEIKSMAAISRVNAYYGYMWKYRPHLDKYTPTILKPAIVIGCTDSVDARKITLSKIKGQKVIYIDAGNGKDFGQVFVQKGPKGRIKDWLDTNPSEEEDLPSCSLAEALTKQNPTINGWVSQIVLQKLSDLLFGDYQCTEQTFIRLNPLKIT